MNINRLIALLPVLLLFSCNPDKIENKIDSQGVTIQLSPVWRSSISEQTKYIAGGIGQAFMTERGILFPKATALPRDPQHARSYLVLKDKDTGQDIWAWNDYLTNFEQLDMDKNRQEDVNGTLLYTSGNRGYGIDMQTGKTIWKTTYTDQWARVATATGSDTFYLTLNPIESYNQSAFKPQINQGVLSNGSITRLLPLVFGADKGKEGGGYKESFGQVNGMRLLKINGEEHLLFNYYDSTPPTAHWYTPRLSLYNLAQKKFVYEGLPMKEAGYLLAVNGRLQVNNGKVYDSMLRYTVCHDLLTGKQLWERVFGSLCDYQLATEDKLLSYISDGNLYCLDANTGQTRWQQECVVTSNLVQLNGVVYYTASQKLCASELQTGKLLWKIDSPDSRQNSEARFRGFVAVVPGKNGQKGRVYAHTGLNAYCYEAIR
ncbi:outer membrane protein assembly factor BamB family protein [Tellurirhabdus bombi]|uniref:outer membrane protein assembly factor BamB family protein n=1 Tax=Tellurirhabdus bombi TaxID=2907205 RepID=UPI001F25308A|nr:PQQ-binding-like beta-propeller repeat protein [Tellurirhabdus bombi]